MTPKARFQVIAGILFWNENTKVDPSKPVPAASEGRRRPASEASWGAALSTEKYNRKMVDYDI